MYVTISGQKKDMRLYFCPKQFPPPLDLDKAWDVLLDNHLYNGTLLLHIMVAISQMHQHDLDVANAKQRNGALSHSSLELTNTAIIFIIIIPKKTPLLDGDFMSIRQQVIKLRVPLPITQ